MSRILTTFYGNTAKARFEALKIQNILLSPFV